MNQCKRCDSTSLTYVTNYEHLDFDEDWVEDNGWLCDLCDCFHIESGDYYQYDVVWAEPAKVNYL